MPTTMPTNTFSTNPLPFQNPLYEENVRAWDVNVHWVYKCFYNVSDTTCQSETEASGRTVPSSNAQYVYDHPGYNTNGGHPLHEGTINQIQALWIAYFHSGVYLQKDEGKSHELQIVVDWDTSNMQKVSVCNIGFYEEQLKQNVWTNFLKLAYEEFHLETEETVIEALCKGNQGKTWFNQEVFCKIRNLQKGEKKRRSRIN